MKLFDSHCHLDDPSFQDHLAAVLERAEAENVLGMMIVGIDVKTARKAISIADGQKGIITSVGIHPHDARHCSEADITTLIQLAQRHACVRAWGETGLDFNRMFSPQKDQEACFIRQLETAGALDLPLIFHERDSNGRFLELLRHHGPETRKGVVHCFSGTKKELFEYLDLGYYVGITGILTLQQRGKDLREMAALIPNDRILIETDAPYLTPAPQKNKTRRNEPAFVKSVLLRLAQIKSMDPDLLADMIFNNTRTLYRVCD